MSQITGYMSIAWTVLGDWWLPGEEARKCLGRFTWTPGTGGELTVYSELVPGVRGFNLPESDIERIDGLTRDGQHISLWNCQGSHANHIGLTCTEQVFANVQVVIGIHCSEGGLTFSRASIEFEHLGAWLRGFTVIRQIFGQGLGLMASFVPELILGHQEDILVSLFIRPEWNTSVAEHRNELSEMHLLRLLSPAPIALEPALDLEHDLRNLLAFATGLPLICNRLTLSGGDLLKDEEVHYIWLQSGSKCLEKDVTFLPYEAILHPGSEEQLSTLVQSWLDLPEETKKMIARVTSLRYLPRLYLELEFLTVAFCLEEFHNLIHPGEELPEEEHEARVAAILNSAPDQHRDWLTQKLRYSNAVTFRRKLKKLLENIPEESPACAVLGKPRIFTDDVVNTRNYHVHHDPKLRKKVLSGVALHLLTKKLTMVLELLALMQLHVPRAVLDDFVRRRWRHLLP